MAELRLPGLSTGIDTNKIVEQLMEVERQRLYKYQQQVAEEEEVRDAYSEFQRKLEMLEGSTDQLADASQLKSYKALTSDKEIMTAEASSLAVEGNHSIQIKQLATSERWAHEGLKYSTSYVKDPAEDGKLILSYNNEEMIIQTTDETTLTDLAGLINNSSDNPGIHASILKYDNGNDGVYHLVLSGEDSGSDYQIKLNDSNTQVYKSDTELLKNEDNASITAKLVDLDTFSGTIESGSTTDQIRIQGVQHDGTGVDVSFDVTAYTTIEDLVSEINDAFDDTVVATYTDGVITITDTTNGTSSMELTSLTFVPGTGSSASLTLPGFYERTEGGSISSSLAAFDSSTFTQTQSAQDSLIKVNDYPPDVAEVQTLTTTNPATAGTFTLTYDGQTTEAINYDATPEQIQDALEALSNVEEGEVTVTGDSISAGGTTTFTFSDALGDVSMLSMDTSGLTPSSSGNYTFAEETKGVVNWISRSTNTVDDVIEGVTLRLHDTTWDGAGSKTSDYDNVEVNLTRDTEQLKETLNGMVSAYNDVIRYIDENATYDPDTEIAGVLFGEYTVTTVKSQIRQVFGGMASGFTGADTFTLPTDIGLELDSKGKLSLDTSTLNDALNEDYTSVLSLIGAMKTGTQTGSDAIKFYGSSERYTTAGTYDIRATVSGGEITSAQIKLSTESDSEWRDAEFDSGSDVVTGNTAFDDQGNPIYPENSLQFTVDTTTDGDYTSTMYIKRGFIGELDETLDDMLNTRYGRVPIAKKSAGTRIKNLNDDIETEQTRLASYEERLIQKYANLEKTLSLIQQQMGALNM